MPFIPVTDYSDRVQQGIIDHRFGPSGVGQLNEDQTVRILAIREGARIYARHIAAMSPPSFERDQALSDLDNVCSWASRAISRNEGGPRE